MTAQLLGMTIMMMCQDGIIRVIRVIRGPGLQVQGPSQMSTACTLSVVHARLLVYVHVAACHTRSRCSRAAWLTRQQAGMACQPAGTVLTAALAASTCCTAVPLHRCCRNSAALLQWPTHLGGSWCLRRRHRRTPCLTSSQSRRQSLRPSWSDAGLRRC